MQWLSLEIEMSQESFNDEEYTNRDDGQLRELVKWECAFQKGGQSHNLKLKYLHLKYLRGYIESWVTCGL